MPSRPNVADGTGAVENRIFVTCKSPALATTGGLGGASRTAVIVTLHLETQSQDIDEASLSNTLEHL
jgi:hypothetical protein